MALAWAGPSTMTENPAENDGKTLGEHFMDAWRRLRGRRPVSFYLLFAMLLAVLLGVQIVYVREDPWRFALFLTLNFVFFMAVIIAALLDGIAIMRRSFRERERLFRNTLGEEQFTQQLREHIREHRHNT